MSDENQSQGIDALREGSTVHKVVELVITDDGPRLVTKEFDNMAHAYDYANQSTSTQIYVYDCWDTLLSSKITSEE
jgi:hypothetical protein